MAEPISFRDEHGCRVRYFRLDGSEVPMRSHVGALREACREGADHAYGLIAEDAVHLYRCLFTIESPERAIVQIQDNDAAGRIVATVAVIEPDPAA